MSSTELAERSPAHELVARISADDFKAQIALALPEGMGVDRFTRATVTALLQNPDLVNADRASLFQAVLRSAQDGLVPDGREAALVMFGKQATYMPMVGGYRKIAAEYGWTIRAHVVYANDEYEYELGLNEKLIHRPARPGVERGDRIAAYAVGVHRDGRKVFWPMDAADVEQCRKASRASSRGPWVDWTDRMWEKTAARRLFERLPLDDAERGRLDRLIAEEFAPGEAATLLYGREVAKASEHTSEGGQQAGEGERHQGDEPAGADGTPDPAPGTDDEPGPATPVDTPAGPDPAAQALADVAALYDPKSQKWPGMTLGEIFNHGDDGRDYVKWCVLNAKRPEFVKASEDLLRVYAPELFHEAIAAREVRS